MKEVIEKICSDIGVNFVEILWMKISAYPVVKQKYHSDVYKIVGDNHLQEFYDAGNQCLNNVYVGITIKCTDGVWIETELRHGVITKCECSEMPVYSDVMDDMHYHDIPNLKELLKREIAYKTRNKEVSVLELVSDDSGSRISYIENGVIHYEDDGEPCSNDAGLSTLIRINYALLMVEQSDFE